MRGVGIVQLLISRLGFIPRTPLSLVQTRGSVFRSLWSSCHNCYTTCSFHTFVYQSLCNPHRFSDLLTKLTVKTCHAHLQAMYRVKVVRSPTKIPEAERSGMLQVAWHAGVSVCTAIDWKKHRSRSAIELDDFQHIWEFLTRGKMSLIELTTRSEMKVYWLVIRVFCLLHDSFAQTSLDLWLLIAFNGGPSLSVC